MAKTSQQKSIISSALPSHVAIIMDGNGRWATRRNLSRFEGHEKGAEAARLAVEFALEKGLSYLTLYAFSSENWHRPADEISGLFGLFHQYIKSELEELCAHGVKLNFIGDMTGLDPELLTDINESVKKTAHNDKLVLTVAVGYGSRNEISEAAKKIAEQVQAGTLAIDAITPDIFAAQLSTVGLPDPELLIRTSGEKRLSNFLLWQMAYTEFIFLDKLWPDFMKEDFEDALREYTNRERRFGR